MIAAALLTSALLGALSAEQHLTVEGGQIAYLDSGGPGPLVVCVPGLGDLKEEYRFVAPALAAQGHRVVVMDLRGHGGSSVGFASHTPKDTAHDVLALLKHLGASEATLVGTSFGAAAVAMAAAMAPEVVRGVVLIGPFVRDVPQPWWQGVMVKVMFAGPWRVSSWTMYWDTLFPAQKTVDHAAYQAALHKNLSEPQRFDAVVAMMNESKASTEALLPRVKAPVLVVMGDKDPDFKVPQDEAALIATKLSSTTTTVAMIKDAGHYPQAEQPAATLTALTSFLQAHAPVPQ